MNGLPMMIAWRKAEEAKRKTDNKLYDCKHCLCAYTWKCIFCRGRIE